MWTLLRNLLFLLLLTTPAHAEWVVIEGEMRIAILFEIEDGDEKIPTNVDRYVICSPGGNFATTHQLARVLDGKPVFYDLALSGGAYIANAVDAKPIQEDSVKGYHWSRYEPEDGIELDPLLVNNMLELIDQNLLQNIINKYKPRYAARIIGLMDDMDKTDFVVDIAGLPQPMVLTDESVRRLPAFKRFVEYSK